MSVFQPIPASSSKPVISGEPTWVHLAEDMATRVPRLIENVAKTEASRLQDELRMKLLRDSEWRPYAENVYVEYDNGELSVYTDSQGATDLEYGTSEIPMNSKLRPFIREAIDTLAEKVDKELSRVLS